MRVTNVVSNGSILPLISLFPKFCSLNHRIRAEKRPNTRNRDTPHVNNDKWLSYVSSRIGLLAANIVQWQPPDDSELASGFVLGTYDLLKNAFPLTRAFKKNVELHTVSI